MDLMLWMDAKFVIQREKKTGEEAIYLYRK